MNRRQIAWILILIVDVAYGAWGVMAAVVTGNVTWDVLAPTNRRPRQVTPFFVAGGGVFQTRERLFNGSYTSSEGAFTAGGGVRALVADWVTLGFELRAGWEPHIRINGLIGLQLWR